MSERSRYRSDGVMHATLNGVRIHLRRTDPIKENFLWVNGLQPPVVVDKTAADFIEALIKWAWELSKSDTISTDDLISRVVSEIVEKYQGKGLFAKPLPRERVERDFRRVLGTIMDLADGANPREMFSGSKAIRYGEWVAPARMDLAVTYRCNLKCTKCYLGTKGEEEFKELSFKEWLEVYDILWKQGVPQIVFTGGEPLLRGDIVPLIAEADEFITGLITNGTMLANLADDLYSASLDYAQVTIESSKPEEHDRMTGVSGSHKATVAGIEAALKAGLNVTTNTTLTKRNAGSFNSLIEFLSSIGVKHVACNTLICSGKGSACRIESGLSDEELIKHLVSAKEAADKIGVELQWYSPTCYSKINPIMLGFGAKSCSAAAHNMTVQPDGSVLPCQSWPEPVGNILTDPWPQIWQHETCKYLRNRDYKSRQCSGCAYESSCAGGCPLDTALRVKSGKKRGGGLA